MHVALLHICINYICLWLLNFLYCIPCLNVSGNDKFSKLWSLLDGLGTFWAGAARATNFLFWRAICKNPWSCSSVSLRFFILCGTNVSIERHIGVDTLDYSCLFFVLCSIASSSSFFSFFYDFFLVFFFFCCSTIIFCIFLAIPKLFNLNLH